MAAGISGEFSRCESLRFTILRDGIAGAGTLAPGRTRTSEGE
jgi:hypothetical protein